MANEGDADEQVEQLLARAKAAAEGRELWRKSGPIWSELLDRQVPVKRIKEVTGVSPGTFGRVARLARRATGRTSPRPSSTGPT